MIADTSIVYWVYHKNRKSNHSYVIFVIGRWIGNSQSSSDAYFYPVWQSKVLSHVYGYGYGYLYIVSRLHLPKSVDSQLYDFGKSKFLSFVEMSSVSFIAD